MEGGRERREGGGREEREEGKEGMGENRKGEGMKEGRWREVERGRERVSTMHVCFMH